jgi:hypothetical protein
MTSNQMSRRMLNEKVFLSQSRSQWKMKPPNNLCPYFRANWRLLSRLSKVDSGE